MGYEYAFEMDIYEILSCRMRYPLAMIHTEAFQKSESIYAHR